LYKLALKRGELHGRKKYVLNPTILASESFKLTQAESYAGDIYFI